MKPEDFFDLKINQKIWFMGDGEPKEKIIDELGFSPESKSIVRFVDTLRFFWKDICADCSLTLPKKKKKVTLYRFTYNWRGRRIWQSHWHDEGALTDDDVELILTESKEIEVDE